MKDLEYYESIETLLESTIKALGTKSYMPKVKKAIKNLEILKDETTKRALNA